MPEFDRRWILKRLLACGLGGVLGGVVAGCGPAGELTPGAGDELVELQFPEDPADEPRATSPSVARPPSLTPGESFTLRRSLEQHLEQPGESGPVVSHSTLLMDYVVTFEGHSVPPAPEEGAVHGAAAAAAVPQFRVRFLQVKQRRELPGQAPLEFDSQGSSPGNGNPLVGCHGLQENGFRFWLSPNHELLAVDDFSAFLDRCAQGVSDPAARTRFRRMLDAAWGSEGPGTFLNDMLGVIPVRGHRPGERWVESRTLRQPLCAQQSTEFVLGATRQEYRGLNWHGRLTPTTGERVAADTEVSVRLMSGETTGVAQIDLRTGLPVELEQTQHLQMKVRTASGREITQTKTTTLRIERQVDPRESDRATTAAAGIGEGSKSAPLRVSQRGRRGAR